MYISIYLYTLHFHLYISIYLYTLHFHMYISSYLYSLYFRLYISVYLYRIEGHNRSVYDVCFLSSNIQSFQLATTTTKNSYRQLHEPKYRCLQTMLVCIRHPFLLILGQLNIPILGIASPLLE